MATMFCGAAPVVARSLFCRPEEAPFLHRQETLTIGILLSECLCVPERPSRLTPA